MLSNTPPRACAGRSARPSNLGRVSYVVVDPGEIGSAASVLDVLGSGLGGTVSGLIPALTTAPPMGGDEVSAAVADLFNGHGGTFVELFLRILEALFEFLLTLVRAGLVLAGAEDDNGGVLGLIGGVLGAGSLL